MLPDFLWVEKYRPKKIADTILPEQLKQMFQEYVNQKEIPNLILSGSAGVGKTTVARAMLEELGCDYIIINGSLNGNIDTLRNQIQNFASSVSLSGGRKYVILDEADYLNANSTQPALRNFMEEFSRNCGFILTCNYKNRIIEPLHSRAPVIEFKISKKDLPKLCSLFMKRVEYILESENVPYERAVLAEFIKKYFPDWRRVINELQKYAATGKIDTGILANVQQASIKEVVSLLKEKKFSEIRKWVGENLDSDQTALFRELYDLSSEYLKPNSIPHLVLILARYQYQAAFAADAEINIMACLVEMMVELEFN